jgi:hypothetical protein
MERGKSMSLPCIGRIQLERARDIAANELDSLQKQQKELTIDGNPAVVKLKPLVESAKQSLKVAVRNLEVHLLAHHCR